jgi:hypothetical protein
MIFEFWDNLTLPIFMRFSGNCFTNSKVSDGSCVYCDRRKKEVVRWVDM